MVAIPSPVRRGLGIRPGDALEWHTFGNLMVLVSVREERQEELLSLLSDLGQCQEAASLPAWEE